ncbi:fucose 4-O-acetylase-like acetyltransferase [Streptomyces sp. 3330]|uniref:acyltransferase family protein n=1 Tax=Streptomyces sp. 3330 TaxID=2817755 RepID=UPI0028650E13|nr:acyltransferase [Streptomyces sp. 3330]MDR6976825.1 fucose 4-O-acetylase-like acetyltransferase [Streptomyces sp. 3330]
MSRDRYVDFLRAWAILLVVLGHWLITGLIRHPDGEITAPELLATVPWTQWLTLGFQIMPLFFLAGGHAAGGSWARARSTGGSAAGWVGQRAVRLLLPTAVYSGLVLLAVGVASALGVDRATLALVGWAMAMQFWFLPVYLLLSALTPVLFALHERWGVRVPVGMGVVALGVGTLVAARAASSRGPAVGTIDAVDAVGALNYLLVWGVVYQLGLCWRDGLLGGDGGADGGGRTAPRARGRAVAMAVAGGAGFALLVGPGPFPVSLILVTGEELSNTDPPSAAMLAWALAQVGVALLVAPFVRRLLERARVRRAVRVLGAGSMALYLWHMLPVLIVAAAFYLTGLAPEPRYGSAGWWALRVPWLLVLGAVLAGVVRALRPLERALASLEVRARPDAGIRGAAAWRMWAGLGVSVWALTYFAGHGFAYGGEFPVWPTVGLAAGTLCVAFPRGSGERDGSAGSDGACGGSGGHRDEDGVGVEGHGSGRAGGRTGQIEQSG